MCYEATLDLTTCLQRFVRCYLEYAFNLTRFVENLLFVSQNRSVLLEGSTMLQMMQQQVSMNKAIRISVVHATLC